MLRVKQRRHIGVFSAFPEKQRGSDLAALTYSASVTFPPRVPSRAVRLHVSCCCRRRDRSREVGGRSEHDHDQEPEPRSQSPQVHVGRPVRRRDSRHVVGKRGNCLLAVEKPALNYFHAILLLQVCIL